MTAEQIRSAARNLVRARGFTITAVLALALGVAVALGMLVLAALGAYLPARAATRIDPMITMRAE